MIRTLLLVGGGSFLGRIVRYLVKISCERLSPQRPCRSAQWPPMWQDAF